VLVAAVDPKDADKYDGFVLLLLAKGLAFRDFADMIRPM